MQPDSSPIAGAPRAAVEPILPLPFALEPRTNRKPAVCLIIPVFNEEKVLVRTHAELARALDALDVDWSILFVNDGSRDGSAAVLESIAARDPRVSYILLSRNFGHQAALTAGFDHATGDVIVCMDADLQHPPELLADLLAAWVQI